MSAVLMLCCLATAALPGGDHYLAGRTAERSGKHADAITAYDACITAESPLTPYARVRKAFCRSASGDAEGAIAAYRALIEEETNTPWARMAQAYLASFLMEQDRHKEAAALFTTALPTAIKPWWVPDYEWRAAECLVADPTTQVQGYAYFSNIIPATPFRKPRIEAADILIHSPAVEDRLLAVFAQIKSGSRSDALEILLGMAPGGASQWKWRTRIFTSRPEGMTYGELGRQLGKVTEAHPKSPWVRVWLAYLVRDRSLAGEFAIPEAACQLLQDHYPGSLETGEALGWLAYRLARHDEPTRAAQTYVRLAQTCPNHSRAESALLTAARLYRETGKSQDALAALRALATDYPDTRYRAGAFYTMASIQEAAGNTQEATASYVRAVECGVGEYYAHRALERLRQDKRKDLPAGRALKTNGADSFLRPFPAPEQGPAHVPEKLVADPRFQRLYFFGTHGLEEGEWEVLGLDKMLEFEALAGVVYQALGEAGLAATAMDYARAHNWGTEDGRPSTSRLRIEYPRAYWPHVCAIAKETGLDPYLLLAVARQESTFRPALTSHAGASGVMQVMPTTAQWLAKVDPNITADHAANLKAPLSSLRMGAYYLMRMVDRSDGNLVYALASYNAGPGNCDKWRKRHPNAGLETFIEAIPFSETRNYVKIVLANYAAYHSLYPRAQ